MATETGGQRAEERDDRDQADLTWLVTGLRRLKVLGPPRAPRVPPGAGESGEGGEQLALFGPSRPLKAPAAPGSSPGPPTLGNVIQAIRDRRATPRPPVPEDTTPVEPDIRARAIVAVATLGYIALFASWTMRNHDGLGSQAYDLGIFDQGVWLLSRFKEPFISINGRNFFGDHTSFILAPFAALYWIVPSAKILLFGQAAALGAAAVPVFLLAREKLRNEMMAALLAVAYLLQPVLGWTNLEQFHPDVFEVPLVLFAIWFMVRQKWVGYFICVGALLLVKEDVSLLTFGLGVYVALRHDKRIGVITCAVSVAYLAFAFAIVIPALNPGGTVYTGRVPFGGPFGFLGRALTNPGEVITYLLTEKRGWYLWQLFAPLGLIALFAPAVLAIGIGPLALNLISSFPYQFDIHYHYSTLILPVLVAATIFGLASESLRPYRSGATAMVVGASLIGAYLWGPTPLGRADPFVADPSSATVVAFHRAEALLPDDAVVSAFYGWVPQISHRTEIYMFPNPFKASYWGSFKQEGRRLEERSRRVQYILVPAQLDTEPKGVLDSVRAEFETIFEEEGIVLMKRRA